MHKIAMATTEERIELFTQTAAKTGLSAAIVEKDFWVCWTLDYLFSRCAYRDSFAFKGGTSLSKAFGLIERFSEDIDLIFDWRMLGYGTDEPWETRSNTKQDAFVEKINADAGIFLLDTLKPLLEADFRNDINGEWALQIEERDPQTLCFHYPRSFADSSILQEIRLETGALAAWTPTTTATITPYVAEQFPKAMSVPSTSVRTVSAERTFWEKATILHKEAFRANGRLPDRYSRHYYDIYRMCQTDVKDNALDDLSLLKQVVEFKVRFWRSNAARYDLCKPGTMRLVPSEDTEERIRDDYARMRNMLFGDVPTFDKVMDAIVALETEINAL
jgi:hypothetical protein